MKLIVGLGNPGEKYKNTRHNLGFWVVDRIKKNFLGIKKKVVFFKNTTFINDSGIDVKKTINRLKIPLEGVLVVHDDFDLELGQFKLQFCRSAAGHKGVRSVIEELGSKDFWRLRIGVGRPPEGVEADDYVLGQFPPPEQEILEFVYPQILTIVQDWLSRYSKTEDRRQRADSEGRRPKTDKLCPQPSVF